MTVVSLRAQHELGCAAYAKVGPNACADRFIVLPPR
jgi:hypothetical protein